MNFPNSPSSRKLYRSRDGIIFGVCKGLAEYSDISVVWIRLLAVIAIFLSGFWPLVLIYIVAAIFLQPAPVLEPQNEQDWEFYQSYVYDRKLALKRLKRQFDSLDRRTRRMENIVTNRSYDWDRRFQSGA